MPPTGEDRAATDRWVDESQVVRVLTRYFRALDDKRFDHGSWEAILAPDATMIRPNGAATVGRADIADSYARSFARFESTQHLLTGPDVDIDGDTAAVRVNLVAIHLWRDPPPDASLHDRSFTAGGVVTATLDRADGGWLVSRIENRVIWRTGHHGDMLQTR